jgi:hypothetical protein
MPASKRGMLGRNGIPTGRVMTDDRRSPSNFPDSGYRWRPSGCYKADLRSIVFATAKCCSLFGLPRQARRPEGGDWYEPAAYRGVIWRRLPAQLTSPFGLLHGSGIVTTVVRSPET